MAKTWTAEEIEKMEEQAELKKRYDAAQSILNPDAGKDRATLEAERRQLEHDRNTEAVNRRLERVGQIALRDPGRYAPKVRKAAVEWMQRNDNLQQSDKDRKNALEIQRLKTEGMRDQGAAAAEAKAEGEEEVAKLIHGYVDYHGNRVKGSQEILAEGQQAAQERLAKLQYGYTDENGVRHEGGNEAVQRLQNEGNESSVVKQGESALKIEQERSKSAIAQMQIKSLTETAKSDEKMEMLRLKSKSKLNEIQFKGLVTQITNDMKPNPVTGQPGLTIDQLREKYKDNPDAMTIINGNGGTNSWAE